MNEEEFKRLDRLFHPRGVAVVGASPTNDWMWLRCFLTGRFRGPVYPVHPREEAGLGLKCYRSLRETPGPVDYAVVAVPRRLAPQILEECAQKGVAAVSMFTSGYSETSTEEGRKLEAELVAIARRGGFRLIGPNCMGFYCPESGLSFRFDLPLERGSVGMASQSGGVAIVTGLHGLDTGIRFSKIVSYGNGADLDSPELVEYLARDPKTRILLLYIEGTRQGRRLYEALHACPKPTVVLKGGATREGARAASSHTGALAGEGSTWRAMLRQAGAIQADDWVEMMDLLQALYYSPLPRGKRVAIVGISGGSGVINTDTCIQAGLQVPPLSPPTIEALRPKFHDVGNSIRNPVDMAVDFMNGRLLQEVLQAVTRDPNIDAVIFMSTFHDAMGPQWVRDMSNEMRADVAALGRRQKLAGKPFLVEIPWHAYEENRLADKRAYLQNKTPVYDTMARAATVIRKLAEWRERAQGRGVLPADTLK